MKLRLTMLMLGLVGLFGMAQAQAVSEWAGRYEVVTPGATAQLTLLNGVDGNGVARPELTVCLGQGRSNCKTVVLYPELVDGYMMGNKSGVAAIPGWVVRAWAGQDGRHIHVAMDSGVEIEFLRR